MAKHLLSRFPAMTPAMALRVLDQALSHDSKDLIRRTALTVDTAGNAMISVLTEHTRPNSPPDEAFEGRLYAAYNAQMENRTAGRSLPADLLGLPLVDDVEEQDLLVGVAGVLAQAIVDANKPSFSSAAETAQETNAEPIRDTHYVISKRDSLPEIASDLARIEWRSTGIRLGGSDGQRTIACVGVDPQSGATQDLAALHPEFYEDGVEIYLPYRCDFGRLLLRPGPALPVDLRIPAARLIGLLLSLRDEGAGEHLLALDWDADEGTISSVDVLLAREPDRDVIPVTTTQQNGGPPKLIDIRRIELTADEETTGRLIRLMEQHAEDIGYRLELQPLPGYAESGDELADVQRQIEELEVRRAYLLGEEEADWRLLRFPAQGIGAMVDFLRRFPLHIADEHRIKYAFHATGQDVAGVHYLLYQLRDIGVEPPYPEAYWQLQAKTGTIAHRLDPLFAQFAASRQASSLVFTPRDMTVVPGFRSTISNVDSYLRNGFGGLLGLKDAFADPDAPDGANADAADKIRRPIYVLGETLTGDVRLEILDGDAFQPIGRVVPFINDNLELSHRIDMEEFISSGAAKYWRKERLDALDQISATAFDQFEERMRAIETDLGRQTTQIYETLSDEVDAVRNRMGSLLAFVEELSERAALIEKIAADAIADAGKVEAEVDELPARFAELNITRRQVGEAVVDQSARSRAFTDLTTNRIAQLRSDIAALRKALADD